VRSIPAGQVASYGQVAAAAGLPRRARLVGRALRGCPADVPWHRVITAAGQLAFPSGSAHFEAQSRRLTAEGVLCRNGRIDLKRYGWQQDLDALLWAPALTGEPSAAVAVPKPNDPE
jgi:methylated-DNA-protein-cysteine methyltransferase-like protein